MTESPRRKAETLSMVVFIDALGWELMQEHSFLDDQLAFKGPLDTVFGYSSACDPSILTGTMPREHGHFSCFLYDPERSPFRWLRWLRFLPRALTRRARVRRVLSRLVGRLKGFTGYFELYNMPFRFLHLFDYSEKRDLYQPGGINSGIPTIFDLLRDEKVPFHLSDWRRSDKDNLAELAAEIERGVVTFSYLFLGGLDAVLHAKGTDSPHVREKLEWYETHLRRMLAHARERYETVSMSIISDHGMTDVHGTCDLMARIDSLGLEFGKDYAAVYDSTMARFWFLRPGASKAILAELSKVEEGRTLTQWELKEFGCDFADSRYGQLFFLMNPGILINPSHMGETVLAGMHGYDPKHPTSLATFACTVVPARIPRHLTDLFALMKTAALESV